METSTTSTNTPLPVRAAQYVRMSTEHQQYSPENQLEVVRQYAASHNMEIVQEYSDHGRCSRRVGQHLLELTANVFQ
jgi:DNA invertase Pin-like site-specific DNA recombinase